MSARGSGPLESSPSSHEIRRAFSDASRFLLISYRGGLSSSVEPTHATGRGSQAFTALVSGRQAHADREIQRASGMGVSRG
jgi:hypothetical protein